MRRERVVDQMLRRAIVGVGCAGHQDDRQVFGVGAGDRVDGGKSADAEGDDGRGRTAGAGVSFGAVAAVQFIAAIDLLQLLVRQQLVEQNQVEVAGDRKMVLQTNLR